MRVLTVRQPWAWAIIHGGKDVENRTRNIAGSYRGPVAIHAGKEVDIMDIAKPEIVGAVFAARLNYGPGDPRTFKESPRGAIIGVVDLVDVHRGRNADGKPPTCWRPADTLGWVPWDDREPFTWNDETGETDTIESECSPWAMRDHYHLMLANPRPIEPIPAKGRLGLWRPAPELAQQITDALGGGE